MRIVSKDYYITKQIKQFIIVESEISRFENYLVNEPILDEQPDVVVEPMELVQNINFVASLGEQENVFNFAGCSW